MVKKVGKYELFRTLGEGTFGKVKYAVNTESQEPVAIKVLDKEKIQKQNMGPQIKKEISIMKIVRHKYVVGMKEVLASRTKIFIVLELVTGGELFDKIVSEGKFSEEMARFYCRQLVEGVEYCHNLGVCHRDLKPENLLLDEQGNLKISDFGLSALYVGDADGDGTSRTELLHTTCGTPNYVAPEVLADKGYDGKKADVWSIGVILYVLLAGFLPFDESTIVALFAKIQAADFTYPKWFSPSVRSLLDSIITADPKARLTLTEVRDAPWLNFDDGDKAFHPVPSLNENVVAARTAAKENADGGDDDDDEGNDNAAKKKAAAAQAKRDSRQALLSARQKENAENTNQSAPTEREIEEGVHNAVGEAVEHGDPSKEGRGAKCLNAFDLVNQCGGFALERVFRPRADKVTKREFQFSSYNSIDQVMIGLTEALGEIGFELDLSHRAHYKIKATLLTAKGMIGLTIQVYCVSKSSAHPLSLVEVRRGKGDIMEFHHAFSELTTRLGNLVNIPESLAS